MSAILSFFPLLNFFNQSDIFSHLKMKVVHIIYLVIIIVLLAVIGGEYHYFSGKVAGMSMAKPSGMPAMSKNGKAGAMPMEVVTPPVESDQQKQQLTDGTSKTSSEKTFNITGGNFYFVPNKITVNKGDKVTFVMTNAGGFHDLVIDELGVKTAVVKTGATVTATFTASKSGSFVYYCDVPNHRKKGMWGTLIVQ